MYRRIATSCVIVLLFSSSSLFADAASDFSQAQSLVKDGYIAPAKAKYEQIVQAYPNTQYAFMATAGAIVCTPKERKADIYAGIDKFLTDYADNNSAPTAAETIGIKFVEGAQYDIAKYVFEKAIQKYPGRPEIKWIPLRIAEVNALALIETSDYDAADTAVKDMIARFSVNTGSVYRIAEKYEEKKQYEQAKNLYQKMIDGGTSRSDWPGLGLARINVLLLIQDGNYAGAQTATNNLIKDFLTHPGTVASLYSIAKGYETWQQYSMAKGIYKQIIQLFAGTIHANWAAIDIKAMDLFTEIQSQNYTEAESKVSGFISDFSKQPGSDWVLYKAARHYEAQGEYQRAMPLYELVRKEYPDFQFVKDYSADVYAAAFRSVELLKAGNGNVSKTEIDNLRTCEANNPELSKNLLFAAEGLYMASYRGGSKPEPNNPSYLTIMKMLNDDTAEKASDRMCKGGIYYTRGLCHRRLGNYLDSADSFMKSIENDPNHEYAGAMHWLIADSYERLKDTGDVNGIDADIMIEWAYKTLFDKYRGCPQALHAALRLGQINLSKGQKATACMYFLWYSEHAYKNQGYEFELEQVLRAMQECQR